MTQVVDKHKLGIALLNSAVQRIGDHFESDFSVKQQVEFLAGLTPNVSAWLKPQVKLGQLLFDVIVCVCLKKLSLAKTTTVSCVVYDQAPMWWPIRSTLQAERWCYSGEVVLFWRGGAILAKILC